MAHDESSSYGLKWCSESGLQWFLRGIDEKTGAFYGEIMRFSAPRSAVNVEGKITRDDLRRFRDLVARFREAVSEKAEGWKGLLAMGRPSEARIVYHFPSEPSRDGTFMEIVKIFEPYLKPFAASLSVVQ